MKEYQTKVSNPLAMQESLPSVNKEFTKKLLKEDKKYKREGP